MTGANPTDLLPRVPGAWQERGELEHRDMLNGLHPEIKPRATTKPCRRCGEPIAAGQLYVVDRGPLHLRCTRS